MPLSFVPQIFYDLIARVLPGMIVMVIVDSKDMLWPDDFPVNNKNADGHKVIKI